MIHWTSKKLSRLGLTVGTSVRSSVRSTGSTERKKTYASLKLRGKWQDIESIMLIYWYKENLKNPIYSKKFKRISSGSGPLSPILLLDKLFINSSEFIHKPIWLFLLMFYFKVMLNGMKTKKILYCQLSPATVLSVLSLRDEGKKQF